MCLLLIFKAVQQQVLTLAYWLGEKAFCFYLAVLF